MQGRPALTPNPYLLVTVASWGFNFVAVKEAYKQMSAPAVALLRFVVMWAALVLVCLWKGESLRLPREDAWRFLYLGFVSMGVYMLLFMEGMRGSGATEGAILLQLSPVFTAILAASVKQERFSKGTLLGALVAFAGTGLVLYGPGAGSANHLESNLIVVASALVWAYSVVLMRSILVRYSPLQVLTLSMGGGAPVMLAYGLVPALRQNWQTVNLYGWVMFVHIALVSGVVAFLCFYAGVRKVGATGATLYQFLVPSAAMLFAALIEGSAPTLRQVAGLIVVLVGVGVASRARYLAQTLAEA